ncbi:MAG: RNA pseudouridine synthase [Treponema sp.]|jgi:23S rRNA pseudouridine1911/1915/1917 synthase|nr:RNA pseudouridine synthase [Treponema sp.]
MSIASRIVQLHDDYLVLNKLPGESVEISPRSGIVDLPRALRQELGDPVPPAAPHRLDVPVSGCVLFARNPRTLAFFGGRFRNPGQVEKIYWGIVEPPRKTENAGAFVQPGVLIPPEDSAQGELVHWLAAGRGNRSLVYDEDGPGRKKSVLRYRVLGRGARYLFLEIRLITGRHHQIRAQLSHIGLPVKGDLKYGARRSEKGGGIRLHCHSLAFPGPAGETVRVEAPPPEIDNLWRAFLDAARQ